MTTSIAENRSKKPSTWLLVSLNGLLMLMALLLTARWPLGYILAVYGTIIFMALSAIWQWLIAVVERRVVFRPVVRTIAYLFPIIAMVGLSCLGLPPQRVNKQRPAISPSGNYTAVVSSPADYWTINIWSKDGASYNETTKFVAHLEVYWRWDASDRFWVYNSDDGGLHFWHLVGTSWEHVQWGWGGEKKTAINAMPPDEVFPDYAKRPSPQTKVN